MLRAVLISLFGMLLASGAADEDRARELYQRAEYRQSLAVILPVTHKNAATLELLGRDYFMLGDYKKASETLEKAVAMDLSNSELVHWLGRAYGRRAETGSRFAASGYASKTRQMFERSVALNPSNKEAVNDLFEYYLQAPGFLGGGIQKAQNLIALIAKNDAAEGQYAQAQLDEKRKDYNSAEQHLKRAAELAPKQVGRVLDVAKFLAKRGRIKESEAMFDHADRMAPNSPRVLYDRADTYIQQKRKLEDARHMLQQYVRSPLTPDDPPREQAQLLLKQIGN